MNDNLPAGVVLDMPADEYHVAQYASSTGLKILKNKTPLHYWAAYLDPLRARSDSPAFRFGRAWHAAVFEPDTYSDHFTVMPEGLDRRTKEGKALWAEIEASGKDVLAASDGEAVQAMAKIAAKHPISNAIFTTLAQYGHAEASIFATDAATSAPVKIRCDYMLRPCNDFPNGLILDGKTTTDASPEGFGKAVWNLDYGLQAAFYTRVFQQAFRTNGRPPFMWLAQEKESPYAAAYYSACADLIAYYDHYLDQLLAIYHACSQRNEWPGYAQQVVDLSLPAWAARAVGEAA